MGLFGTSKRKRRKTHYVPDGGVDLYASAGLTEWGGMWGHSKEMGSPDVLEFAFTVQPVVEEAVRNPNDPAAQERMLWVAREALEKLLAGSKRWQDGLPSETGREPGQLEG